MFKPQSGILHSILSGLLLMLLSGKVVLGQECGIIYVTPSGASSGAAGTKSNPASLTYGLSLANASSPLIRMSVGNYALSAPLVLKDSIVLEGGFLPAQNWAKTNADSTLLIRNASNVQANPDRLIAIVADSIRNFRLQDLRINVADAPAPGVSLYGIYLRKCRSYNIVRCWVRTGNAGNGVDGVAGIDGSNGADGTNGGGGCRQCDPTPAQIAGGNGGNSWSAGSNKGGNGGTGAQRGTGTNCDFIFEPCPNNDLCDPSQAIAPDGGHGTSGSGVGAGVFGPGKLGLCYCNNGLDFTAITNFLASCPSQDTALYRGSDGQAGLDGVSGLDGINGVATLANGFWIPQNGTDGASALNGAGGGGGGGGSSIGCIPGLNGLTDGYNSSGAGGGGGGEGGQAGTLGTKGTGAGANFAVFLWENGPNGRLRDCILQTGLAGVAGKGGKGGKGGLGGDGGFGGNEAIFSGTQGSGCEGGAGGNGGKGGNGGDGGDGGNGSEGIVAAVYEHNSLQPVAQIYNMDTTEAKITISFTGCSNVPVQVSTSNTANVIDWFLGGIPSAASGPAVVAEYPTTGYKSLSVMTDGIPYNYADFVNVSIPFNQPEIISSLQSVCTGQNVNLSTLAQADNYSWSIPGGSITTFTGQNPGNVTFNTPGQYNITLFTTTCCGISKIDTVKINVISTPTVQLPQDLQQCVNDPLPILYADGFPDAVYQWKKDGSVVSAADSLITTGTGLYELTVSYPGGCSASDTYQLTIVPNLPVNIGPDVTICGSGTPPLLNAGFDGSSYLWYKDNVAVSVNQLYQTTLPGTYKVVVTNQYGCTGVDEMNLIVSSPMVDLGEDIVDCPANGQVILDAQNAGSSYQWTSAGTVIGAAQTQVVTTTGFYEVKITNSFGCDAFDTIHVTVGAPLTPNFNSSATSIVNQVVNFTDITTPTPLTWIWNFGDGSALVTTQNPTHTFTSAGIKPVTLIVTNGICSDTIVKEIQILADCATLGLDASFSMNPDTLNLNDLGQVQFTNNSTNENTVLWNFGDNTSSTAQNPSHVYQTVGTYNITLYAMNENCIDSITQTLVVIKPSVSIDQTLAGGTVTMYPNPSSGQLNIQWSGVVVEKAEVQLFGLNGQLIKSEHVKSMNGNYVLGLENLADGLYVIQFITDKGVVSQRIILENR